MARALDSVPPLVKVMEPGFTATRSATCARATSISDRAARPAACTDEGLPPISSARTTAAFASGRTGAVAL